MTKLKTDIRVVAREFVTFSVSCLIVGLVAPLIVTAEPLEPLLTPLDPSFVLTLESTNGNYPTFIDFHNATSDPVSVSWINYSGQEVHYADLSAGQSYTQQTYLTHPWIIEDLTTSRDIVGFLPEATQAYANIVAYHPSSQTLINFNGGNQNTPVLLPQGSISEVTGLIGGTNGPTEQYYSFAWRGGTFTATGLVDDYDPSDVYYLNLIGGSTTYSYQLSSVGNFQGTINVPELPAGTYRIGFFTPAVVAADPAFDLQFNTPVLGDAAVPEPTGYLLSGLGLATVCVLRAATRRP